MMQDHAAAIEQAAGKDAALQAELWRQESALLESEPKRMPFAGTIPPQLQAAVAPFAEELSGLFCRSTDALELLRIKRHGIGYGDND